MYPTVTHQLVKNIASLQTASGRLREKAFLVEGKVLVEEAMRSGWKIHLLLLLDSESEQQGDWLVSFPAPVYLLSALQLKKLSSHQAPPGIIAVVEIPPNGRALPRTSPLIICDHISDPGNLGTIIRTADWFGMHTLWISSDTVDPFNEKVVRSAMGSLFRTEIYKSTDLVKELTALKSQGYKLVMSALGGSTTTFPASPVALVLGNEAHGVSLEVQALADSIYTIPGHGKAESLNVAVSFGIMAYLLKLSHG